jgi:hypothetical protein
MSSKLVYGPIPELSRTEIEEAIRRDDSEELLIAVVSAALYLEPDFSESTCIQLAKLPNFNVRGKAILGFAHIARLHSNLNKQLVRPLMVQALIDDNEYVRGQAEAAKDDLEHFLGWKF